MSLLQDIIEGIKSGLLLGVNATFDEAEVPTVLDFSVPVTQVFGSSSATHQYLLQETSGNYADTGTGTTADIDTFSGGAKGQTAPGIYDGSSYVATKAWEALVEAATHTAAVSNVIVFNSDGADLYVRIYFRAQDSSAGRVFASKRTGSGSGWDLTLNADGTLTVTIEDGSGNTANVSVVGNHAAGPLHYLEFFYDVSEDELTVNSDLDLANSAVDVSVVTGSLDTAAKFTLGNASAAHMQVICVEGGEGAAAATMFAETGWWTHSTDPSELMGNTATSRTTGISVPVSAEYVAHFAPTTVAIRYHAALEGTKLGLATCEATTNLILYSELSTGSTNVNATPTDSAVDAPDGFRGATSLVATANNGYQAKVITTSASKQYTGSVFIAQSTVGATGRVILYDETNTAELGATAFTTTTALQRIQVTASTIGGGISTSLRVEIDTDTHIVIPWGWQVELGNGASDYVRTNNGTDSRTQAWYRATDVMGAEKARVEITAVKIRRGTSSRYLMAVGPAQSGSERRAIYLDTSNGLRAYISLAGNVAIATTAIEVPMSDNTRVNAVMRWDYTGLPEDGTKTVTCSDVDTITTGTNGLDASSAFETLDLTFGNSDDGLNAMDGAVQLIRIYLEPGEAPTI